MVACVIIRRSVTLLLSGGFVAITFLATSFAATPPALAYTVCTGSSGAAPSSVAGGQAFTFTVTSKQTDGTPAAGVGMTFSQMSGPSGSAASFNPVSTVTDANGIARTTVVLPTGSPGAYVLAATVAVAGACSVTVTVVETGGFPNTSSVPAAQQFAPWWVIGGVAGGALGLAALFALLLLGGRSAMRRSA